MSLSGRLHYALEQKKAANTYRVLKQQNGLVDFVSNDYLGLAQSRNLHQEVWKHFDQDELMGGSTGSRLLSGNSPLHQSVEDQIANFHNAESSLVFNSGYQANTGLLSSLLGKDDTILFDKYIHASLRQGIQLSYAKAYGFSHNDLEDLKQKSQFATGEVLVVVESIYSMDGDEAPLEKIASFCRQKSFAFVVDEAHATGIRGPKGTGVVQEKGLEGNVFARIHTFGKALGGQGAAVLGDQTLKSYLVNFAKPFIYTTALPPIAMAFLYKVYEFFPEMESERERVLNLGEQFESLLMEGEWQVIKGRGPIRSVIVKGETNVKALAEGLQKAGFDLRPIVSPTVPKGLERLRICFHSYNTQQQVDDLVRVMKDFGKG